MAQQDGQKAAGKGRRYALWGAAGIGAALAAGAAYLVYREKSVEKPKHRLIESDGDFELREYESLLVAETQATGGREDAVREGFTRLADYIFARGREAGPIAMTAPVLADAQAGGWRTRFVMPGHLIREQLPAPQEGVKIATIPARRVACLFFPGSVDEAVLTEREAQLRSWIGAKKLNAAGATEFAFYNSPTVPAGMRRNEVLIPVG